MEPFHLIISAIFSPVCALLSQQNWTNLEHTLISWLGFVVIADTWGGRWLIDSSDSAARIQTIPFPPVMSQCRRQVQRPRSASLRPAITQSTHTIALQRGPVSSFGFCYGIEPDSTPSCVLNWDSLDFNDPIVAEPFIEDFGSSSYENNGTSSVQIFWNEATGPGANLNIHLSVHVLLRFFDDFPQLLLRSYRNSENKTSANADGILFSLRGAEILLRGFRFLFWICYTEPHSASFTKPTFVFHKFPGS